MRPSVSIPGRIAFCLLAIALLLPTLRADDDSYSSSTSSRESSSGGTRPGQVVDYYQNRVLSPIVWNVGPGPITKLVIHLSECKLYGFQGSRMVAMTSISPGKDGHDTPIGDFKIIDKDKDHKSTLYGSYVDGNGHTVDYGGEAGKPGPPGTHFEAAPMLFYLRLTDDGVGLHAGYVTGTRVSHGCMRMPPSFAEDLFPLVSIGTPVSIEP